MAHLCLGIGADDLKSVAERQPLGLLLWSALGKDRGNKHSNVELESSREENKLSHVDSVVEREFVGAHEVPGKR